MSAFNEATTDPLAAVFGRYGEPVDMAAPAVPCRDHGADDRFVELGKEERARIVGREAL